MKLRQIIPLVAILGLSACEEETKQLDPADAVMPTTSLPSFPEGEPIGYQKCNFPVSSTNLEEALNTLHTEAGRAKVVTEIMDRLGFQGWVQATGSQLFGCTGVHVPLRRERITAAIDYYRKMKEFEMAVELAEDAMWATNDYKAFGSIRALTLEGARDPSLPADTRIYLYTKASEHGNRSYEENVRLAEEVISYFISMGQLLQGQRIIEILLPDQVPYKHEDGRKEQLTIPPSIKAKRDELLARLERHSGDSSKRLDVPEPNYPRYDPAEPCENLAAEIERGSITHLEEAVRSTRCSPALILRGYETAGRFLEAAAFTRGRELKNLARAYQVVQVAMEY